MFKDFLINGAPLLYMEPDYHPNEPRVNCVGIRYEKDHYVVDCFNVYTRNITSRVVYEDEQGTYVRGLAGHGSAYINIPRLQEELLTAFNRFAKEFRKELKCGM